MNPTLMNSIDNTVCTAKASNFRGAFFEKTGKRKMNPAGCRAHFGELFVRFAGMALKLLFRQFVFTGKGGIACLLETIENRVPGLKR